jgi:hypothetical protein
LESIAAWPTYVCGFMCFDDEVYGIAQHHYLIGLRLSAEAGDHFAHSMILRAPSLQARLLGHRNAAVDLAEAAVRATAKQVPVHARACLLGRLGAVQAVAGDHRSGAATLEAAERNFSHAEDCTSSIDGCHPASLDYQRAVAAVCVGDRANAIRSLEWSARRRFQSEQRARAITLARLAELQLSGCISPVARSHACDAARTRSRHGSNRRGKPASITARRVASTVPVSTHGAAGGKGHRDGKL